MWLAPVSQNVNHWLIYNLVNSTWTIIVEFQRWWHCFHSRWHFCFIKRHSSDCCESEQCVCSYKSTVISDYFQMYFRTPLWFLDVYGVLFCFVLFLIVFLASLLIEFHEDFCIFTLYWHTAEQWQKEVKIF